VSITLPTQEAWASRHDLVPSSKAWCLHFTGHDAVMRLKRAYYGKKPSGPIYKHESTGWVLYGHVRDGVFYPDPDAPSGKFLL